MEIKSLSSPDVDIDVWEAESQDDVFFLLELEIGLAGSSKADLFEVVVATPEGLRRQARSDVIADRATLIVSDFSWPLLRKALSEIVRKCEGRDWQESVLKLQRYFHWEYEDYIRT